MRRIVFVIPELLGEPSFLEQRLPAIEQMAEMGRLFKLGPTPKVETPEALYLGLSPEEGQLRQGPLTVSALGADPPERSTHFHLSLMSHVDGHAGRVPFGVPEQELRQVLELAQKLNTKALTLVPGEGVDHALVWEGLGDLRTTPPAELEGNAIRDHLPEGDAEAILRRYIDDSINLLSEIELNHRRAEEELAALNMLWPWGQGVRTRVPNLALKRGEPALVMSSSLRLAGLTRLAGYRHGDRGSFGKLTNTRLNWILEKVMKEPVTIVLLDAVQAFRENGQLEEGNWLVREMESALISKLLADALRNPTRMTLLAPGAAGGLGVSFETGNSGANSLPFDERAFDEKALSKLALHEAVQFGLS